MTFRHLRGREGRLLLLAFAVLFAGCKSNTVAPPAVHIFTSATGGPYYKGKLDSTVTTPPLVFKSQDVTGAAVTQEWIHFRLTDGDGLLSNDSIKSDSLGNTYPTYRFSDTVGHAVLAAFVRGYDTTHAYLRASILDPSLHGQGQYVSFDDNYLTVEQILGTPDSIQVDPSGLYTYADYERLFGVIPVISDVNGNHKPDSTEKVFSVIVTTIYSGKTVKGIGIGSKFSDVVNAYGTPDTVILDPTPPPARLMVYASRGIFLYAADSDSTIFQIEVTNHRPTSAPKKNQEGVSASTYLELPLRRFDQPSR